MPDISVAEVEGGFRLYYSAGLAYLRDCRFSEPKHTGTALARHVLPSSPPDTLPAVYWVESERSP